MKMLFPVSVGILLTTSLYAAPMGPKLTEAEITNAIMTVNTEEMNLANIAKQYASNQKVKSFANQMFTDHSTNNDVAQGLQQKENLKLKETADSMKIKFSSEDEVEKLKTLRGKSFDKAYIKSEVGMHKTVLDKINHEYIPNTQDKDLRALLDKTKAKVEQHLKMAEEINKTL
ncbi:MAG: DUF4142 domain-containing protein [Bacteriovoracaceae bacterium]